MDKRWQDDPKLKNMDKEKLEMLQRFADQGAEQNMSAMLPFLMNAASRGRSQGLSFTPDEISAIMEVLKAGKSPREAAKLDKIVNLMRMIR